MIKTDPNHPSWLLLGGKYAWFWENQMRYGLVCLYSSYGHENASAANPDPHSQNSLYFTYLIHLEVLREYSVGWRLFTMTSTVKCCIKYTHTQHLWLSVDYTHMAWIHGWRDVTPLVLDTWLIRVRMQKQKTRRFRDWEITDHEFLVGEMCYFMVNSWFWWTLSFATLTHVFFSAKPQL